MIGSTLEVLKAMRLLAGTRGRRPKSSRSGKRRLRNATRTSSTDLLEPIRIRRSIARRPRTTATWTRTSPRPLHRKIDLQNSWFAAPVLAAPLAVMGLEGAAAWAARTALPKAEQAALQFVEREPYLRVGDNWATRAGRRAHAALKELVTQKPGWDPEPAIELPDGRIVRPDVRTPPRLRGAKPDPEPFLMELKPNTSSGLRAAARAVRRYEELTGLKTRPLLYDPKPFI
jgi:hypothetical protein